jgi:cation diffusion facilitator family transporter
MRERAVRRVLIVTLVLNLAVAGAKVVAGVWFHILSLTADGLHSSLDGLNNVIGLVALGLAGRPPDEGHPYGHRKFETFAALGIGVSLGVLGAGLVREAILRVGSGFAPRTHPITFVVAVTTLLINVLVARYELRRGRELASELLVADAQHTRGDVMVTLGVLAALCAVALHLPALDLVAALAIAAFIAWTAYRVIAQNVSVLADAAVFETERVMSIARAVDGVRSVHKVRSRGAASHVFIDLHVQVDPAMPTLDSHALGHRVAAELKRQLPGVVDVLVHVEPFHSPD